MTRPEVLFLTALLCLSWETCCWSQIEIPKLGCYRYILSMRYNSSTVRFNAVDCRITSSGYPATHIVNCSGVQHDFIVIAIDRQCPVSSVELSQGGRSSRLPVSPYTTPGPDQWPWFHSRCSHHDIYPWFSDIFQLFQPYDDADRSSIYSLSLYDDNDDVVVCATSELYAGALRRSFMPTTERPQPR